MLAIETVFVAEKMSVSVEEKLVGRPSTSEGSCRSDLIHGRGSVMEV
jgi:hypothetical protein